MGSKIPEFVASAVVMTVFLPASNERASAADNVGGVVAGYVDKCMHEPANRSEITSASWGHEKYFYTPDPLTEADKLNGVTSKGTVTLDVPVRNIQSQWQSAEITFATIEQQGTLTVGEPEDNLVGPFYLGSAHWSCRFRNGRQVE